MARKKRLVEPADVVAPVDVVHHDTDRAPPMVSETARRGLGCLRDPDDTRDKPLAVADGVSVPDSYSLSWQVTQVFDQAETQSCVAQAVAQAIRMGLGSHLGSPSRRWIYTMARLAGGDQVLMDQGAYIRAAFKALAKIGWADESSFGWNPEAINERPTADVYREAADRRWLDGYYRIVAAVEARRAIAAGMPVVFGADVDAAFMDCRSNDINELDGPSEGGHAMVAVGYDVDSVQIVNSWGRKWGNGGFGRISWEAFIRRASDLWVAKWVEA